MANAGTLTVTIQALTSKFEQGMGRVNRSLTGFQKTTTMVMGGLKRLAVMFGLSAGVYGIGRLIGSNMRLIDNLGKTSDKLGIQTEKLQAMRQAAELSGVAARTLDMGLQRMVRRIAEAAQGTGEARNALAELGLDAQRLAKLSPDEQFKAIADRMSLVADQGDRVRLAMRLFDSEGVALVNTLSMGRQGLQDVEDELRQTGALLDRQTVKKVEDANDAINNMKKAWGSVAQEITSTLAPALETVANLLTSIRKATTTSIEDTALGQLVGRLLMGEDFMRRFNRDRAAGPPTFPDPKKQQQIRQIYDVWARSLKYPENLNQLWGFMPSPFRGAGVRSTETTVEPPLKETSRLVQEITYAGEDMGYTLAQSLADVVTGARDANEALQDMLRTMAMTAIRTALSVPIQAGVKGLMDAIPGLLKGQHGLDVMATRPTLFMAGEGNQPERVTIDPGGRGSPSVVMNVYAQDAGSFRRSESQIARGLRRRLMEG